MRTSQTNKILRSQPMVLEALEGRQYYSAKLIPTTPGFIGPVKPSSESTITETTTTETTTTTTTTTTGTTSTTSTGGSSSTASGSKTFGLYDSSFGTSAADTTVYPGFQQSWWTGTASMSDETGYDPSKPLITTIANTAKNGGNAHWTNWAIHAGALTFLDFEGHNKESISYYVQRINWYHQANPTGQVGIWGMNPGFEGLDRDSIVHPNAQAQAMIQAQLKADAPLINAMDVVIIPAYLLGRGYEARDCQFIQAEANYYHQAFPGKTVLAWTWGAYHTSWNPVNDVFSNQITQEYVQACLDSCDGMVVWGSNADNYKLHQFAVEMAQPALQDSQLPPTLSQSNTNAGLFSSQPINSDLDKVLA